jgi:hypothetical protein
MDEAAAGIKQYAREVVATAPPLTTEQRNELAELLEPVRSPVSD